MHSVYNVKFDGRKIIEYFGGVKPTAQLMAISAADIEDKTVQKWKERDNIPADAVASLMLAARKTQVPFDPYDFLLTREKYDE